MTRPALGRALRSAVLLLIGAGACGEPPPARLPVAPLARFIAEEPTATFALDEVVASRTIRQWDVTTAAEAAEWSAAGAAVVAEGASADGLPLAPEGRRRKRLVRTVSWHADDVHRVDVELSIDRRARITLRWYADAEGPAAGELSQEVSSPRSGRVWYRFPVASHPGWRDRIDRVEVSVGAAKADARLFSLATVVEELDPARLETATGRPWKVDLGSEVRESVVVGPDQPVVRTVRARDDSVLRFGFGLAPGARSQTRFRVLAGKGRSVSEVWSRTLDPAVSGESGHWQHAEVALGAWSGKDVRLELDIERSGEPGTARDLAFWAHPTVVWTQVGKRRPDVFFISVDTLRADRLSLYGYPKRITPRIDSWARRRGVTFARTVAAAPWTLPSHWSMLTGVDAVRHGRNHDTGPGRKDGAELTTLAEILRSEGYVTGAFTGGGYLHPRYGFDAGFERYGFWPNRGQSKQELLAGTDRFLGWAEENRGAPRFFFLHTYAVHDPYRPWRPFIDTTAPAGLDWKGKVIFPRATVGDDHRTRLHFSVQERGRERVERPLTAADQALIDALYDSGVARMDLAIGKLLAQLMKAGELENAIVVLTSDHGEALGEHGRAGHVDLYDVNVLVPLIVWFPDRRGHGRTVDQQVRSVDLVPTILEEVGLAVPPGLDGVSLRPLVDRDDASAMPAEAWSYSARAGRGLGLRLSGDVKLVLPNNPWAPERRAELFDLHRDPHELRDRAADDAELAAQLTGRARAYLDQHASGLRLRFDNGEGGPLRGRLIGDAVRPGGTKSVDAACGCLRWDEEEGLVFDIPPGRSVTLRFEVVFGDTLRVQGEKEWPGGVAPFRHAFSVGSLDGIAALRFESGVWSHERPEEPEQAVGIAVWWPGRAQLDEPSPGAVDPELRGQLEALGYGG